ncbi:hypothetical protein DFO67_13518 [Modicisalibacter xianhensis]|uniref:Holin n=1 Tax=Modicisalibacter xianhensis TaxID=442341 RepID=A0A4R8FD41_9GAMM|nr:hypothetical protein [Halomonas xianhensis]TDX21608.1 hypothetical protein DFO67_13518 [Halomonas xianhensis]
MRYLTSFLAALAIVNFFATVTGTVPPDYWVAVANAAVTAVLLISAAGTDWDDYFHAQDEIED